MNERLLSRLLFGCGLITISLFNLFGLNWAESGFASRALVVVSFVAAVVGLLLDIKHRREDKGQSQQSEASAA